LSDNNRDVRIRVAGILIKGGRLLLIAHKKNDEVYWLLPGGGVDYGESLSEALKREFIEELNVSVEVNDVAMISDSIDPSGDRHVVNICFLCTYSGGDFELGEEQRLYDYRFFGRDEIEAVKIFPPINNDLLDVMDGKNREKYKGKLWK